MEYILIFIAAVFVNNIVLAQFLGICPFLGVSKKVSTALGMTGAVTFVMILATLVTFIVQKTILDPFEIGFMQTITDHCSLGTNGRNHIEKGQSFALSGIRCVLALDHHQLCCTGSCHYGDPKRFQLTRVFGIRSLYSDRFRIGPDDFCRYP